MMDIASRIKTLHILSKYLDVKYLCDEKNALAACGEKWREAVANEHFYHSWFIPEFVDEAVAALVSMMEGPDGKALERWAEAYPALAGKKKSRRIGVIMAGNIPLVGFHDFLCTFVAGDLFVGKMSSNDTRLWPILLEMLCLIEPEAASYVSLTDGRLEQVDAVIATGSNNSSRYFEAYFGKYPHIIRKHCNGVAVLDGNESEEELQGLAKDICLYFGLGCRNVAKIYLPEKYDFKPLFDAIDTFKPIYSVHHSYLNNLEYQKTVHLINSIPFLDQGICMFKENEAFASPISVVHYSYYTSLDEVWEQLRTDEVQCVATRLAAPIPHVALGETQYPSLTHYANGVDTMEFLTV